MVNPSPIPTPAALLAERIRARLATLGDSDRRPVPDEAALEALRSLLPITRGDVAR